MDVFDLQAKIRLDDSEYKNGLSAIKGTLADFAKFSVATLGAAATGVSAIVKESVSAYADYEQLAGGIETLFGSSAETVMKNAEKAYLTAGQSMNEYMETSIQSAASLINSLGGDQAKAAELMDLSITDMADNVNKMGTNMEAVQNAYRGFSRQNFTMLDNLALGFAGTKQGMQDLLDKAQEISGIQYDISSYSDIVQAIHVVQEEMGITGTTAKEASGTISGSIASMKSAWENLKVEISKDDGNVGEAFDKLSETAGAAFDNMLPRVEKALDGVGSLIVKAAPKIGQSIAKIVPKVLPSLMETSVSVISSIGTSIVDSLPTLIETGSEVVETIGNTLLGYLPDWLSDDIRKIISSISGFAENIDFDKIKTSLGGLGESLEPLVEKLSSGVAWAFENVLTPLGEWLVNDAIPLGIDLISGALDNIKNVLDILEPVGKAVWEEFLSPLFSTLGDLAVGSLDLLGKGLKSLAEAFEDFDTIGFVDDIIQGKFGENWKAGLSDIADSLEGFGDNIDEFFDGPGETWNRIWQNVGGAVFSAKETIVDAFSKAKSSFDEFKDDWITGMEEIVDKIDKVKEKIGGFWDFWYGFGDYLATPKAERNMIPTFGDGGRVTKPTLAIVGEKEPETIVPDSKKNQMGGNTINISINVEGGISSDYDVERIAQKLAELSVLQTRAIGGTGF